MIKTYNMTFYINSNLLACHIGFNLSSHVLKLKIIEVINYMIVLRCYEVCLLVSFLPLLIEKKKKESPFCGSVWPHYFMILNCLFI